MARRGASHRSQARSATATAPSSPRYAPSAKGDEIEALAYGFSITCCLPDGLSHQPSAATGTVLRPETLRHYARRAGFAGIEVLAIEDDFFRFYRPHQCESGQA